MSEAGVWHNLSLLQTCDVGMTGLAVVMNLLHGTLTVRSSGPDVSSPGNAEQCHLATCVCASVG